MSKEKPPVTPEGVAPIAQTHEIVIQYTPATGHLQVKGPPDNIMCLGMLGVATEIFNSRGRENITQSPIMRV
jgi:hypothetical protein